MDRIGRPFNWERVANLREERGITQRELGRLARMSQTKVSFIETGRGSEEDARRLIALLETPQRLRPRQRPGRRPRPVDPARMRGKPLVKDSRLKPLLKSAGWELIGASRANGDTDVVFALDPESHEFALFFVRGAQEKKLVLRVDARHEESFLGALAAFAQLRYPLQISARRDAD
jgi:DNA-binding XRE family transcriptional regulator